MPDAIEKDRIESPNRDVSTIRFTIGSLCALSAATWWYTLCAVPFYWAKVFISNIANGQTGDEYIRMFLRFHEIFSMSACFLWLLYLYGDIKKVFVLKDS
jgi:hypothetical protein